MLEHIEARTYHARRGGIKNAFTYGVDMILTDFGPMSPWPISRNRFNLWSLWDKRHGGPRGAGRGMGWFRKELSDRGFSFEKADYLLLTQPSFLWFHFNPVSFWIAVVEGAPRAFVAEVNNTFGDRHCYFCAHDDFAPIAPTDALKAEKLMHVSPYQKVAGHYRFTFGMTQSAFDIQIRYEDGSEGVFATLSGKRNPATARSLLGASVRRPLGCARVVFLIHWQAVKLRFKRAPFMRKPPAPARLVSGHPPKRVREP